MIKIASILRDLKKQREQAQAQADRLNRAIEALSGIAGGAPGTPKRHMSVAGRRRIAAAQRARWAKIRGKKRKRNISPEGRRRISESARRRWAAARKAHGNSVAPMRLLSNAQIAAMQRNAAKAAKAAKAP